MRYQWGMGVGHTYSHPSLIIEDVAEDTGGGGGGGDNDDVGDGRHSETQDQRNLQSVLMFDDKANLSDEVEDKDEVDSDPDLDVYDSERGEDDWDVEEELY